MAAVVLSGLSGAPQMWSAALVLAFVLAIHVRYALGALTGVWGGWWTIAVAAWLTYLPLALLGPAWVSSVTGSPCSC
ncbi:hypothetical protein ACIBHX_05690 [Nonomuraea sp. NPDC050536]|uniref:hypothetical protein n=1 Tax=Nonomuraea sp. NPDC050536 TaxID=3364366 RepID=UPI0037CB48E0